MEDTRAWSRIGTGRELLRRENPMEGWGYFFSMLSDYRPRGSFGRSAWYTLAMDTRLEANIQEGSEDQKEDTQMSCQNETELYKSLQNSGVPEHMHGAFVRWVMSGIPPGNFGCAVLENNLKGAVGRADRKNITALEGIVSWLYWEVPGECWGSPEKVKAWRKLGGFKGKYENEGDI